MNDNASNNAGHRAAIPNPALNVFNALVGEWEAVGTHPQIPHTTLRGHASFQWLEGGAFLGLHTTINYPEIPAGTAIFGSDNTKNEYWMLYFDERGVSRKYEVALQENGLKWWRDAPEFSPTLHLHLR